MQLQCGEISDREFLFRSLLTIDRELFPISSHKILLLFIFGHVDLPFNTGD